MHRGVIAKQILQKPSHLITGAHQLLFPSVHHLYGALNAFYYQFLVALGAQKKTKSSARIVAE